LKATAAGELGWVVVNGAEMALYRFDKDTAKPSRSACGGKCAKTWPPVLVTAGSKTFLAGVQPAAVVGPSTGSRRMGNPATSTAEA
jgi:hypothetical protein